MSNRTRVEVDQQTQRRIQSLERRLARMASSMPTRGTSALRDATFVPPTTDAERAAFANRQILWYNTERGWQESYYAPTGIAGLTARGLVAGLTADWYPTGTGPECRLTPTAEATAPLGGVVPGWNGIMLRSGGSTWFTTTSTGIAILIPGKYDISVRTVQQNGGGLMDWYVQLTNAGQTAFVTQWQGPLAPLQTNLFRQMSLDIPSHLITSSQFLRLASISGGPIQVHKASAADNPRGHMLARYVGPPLISD